jgi:hypothetical protein
MKSPIIRRLLLPLIYGLTIALLVVIGYKLAPTLFPPADARVLPDPGCDLQRTACSATVADGQIALNFLTRPIPLAKPFQVSLATRGINPGKVELDFAGIEMDMGYNRTVLKSAGDGNYFAEITLPVCITGRMKWRATVIVHTRRERLSIPYEFLTGEAR